MENTHTSLQLYTPRQTQRASLRPGVFQFSQRLSWVTEICRPSKQPTLSYRFLNNVYDIQSTHLRCHRLSHQETVPKFLNCHKMLETFSYEKSVFVHLCALHLAPLLSMAFTNFPFSPAFSPNTLQCPYPTQCLFCKAERIEASSFIPQVQLPDPPGRILWSCSCIQLIFLAYRLEHYLPDTVLLVPHTTTTQTMAVLSVTCWMNCRIAQASSFKILPKYLHIERPTLLLAPNHLLEFYTN